MKKQLIVGAAALVLMAVLPVLSAQDISVWQAVSPPADSRPEDSAPVSDSSMMVSVTDNSKTASEQIVSQDDKKEEEAVFRILDTASGQVVTVNDRAFCLGAVAYEMPPFYEKEALKAQCVACYTHFSRWREQQREQPDPDLQGADFRADLSRNEYYFSDEALRKQWGTLYEQSYQSLSEAVNECFGELLRDQDGALIDAAYFALSSGVTEDAKDIFGFESDYLRAVASPFDRTAPDYQTVVAVSRDELVKTLSEQDKDFSLGEGENPIGAFQRTASGSVLSAEIGSRTYAGADPRTWFGLRSQCFSLTEEEGQFVFTVLGYGHGVGMSQYGANEMAKQGADYHEILAHYYQGIA